jgi:catechol 2,3-dioxygenase-like lactoylglutathione lyase family enzyme
VTLCVTDIKIATDFYVGLGGKSYKAQYEKGEFVDALIGEKGVEFWSTKIVFEDNTRLELMEFSETSLSRFGQVLTKIPGQPNMVINYGYHHIAFTVIDLGIALLKIETMGGMAIMKPIRTSLTNSPLAVNSVHAYALDPFGNIIHLAQDLTDEKVV